MHTNTFDKILELIEQGYEIKVTRHKQNIVEIKPVPQLLDLDELKKFRDSLLIEPLQVNGVLLGRKEARY